MRSFAVGTPLAECEIGRLDALRSLRILDTPPERAFDDLTCLASYICGTPIAFVGFMDADRLWFKSRIGWDVPEVPREMSFCAHTILQSDALVVSDTLADQGGLASCPLATHGGIRFYAGVPLMSSEGYALGTLGAMDSIPRGLTPGQTEALRKLARQLVNLVESRLTSKALLRVSSIQQGSGSSDETGKNPGFSLWQDISEQKRAQEALRHSEQRLQGIIGSAMDAIITIDNNQHIVVFNKAAEQIFRCTASEALGRPIDKFIPEKFRAVHGQHIQGFARTGVTTRSMYSPGTLFAHRADGEEFPIEAAISQVEADGEKLFTVILRDISARRRMEAELLQAQKMEAVGQLAGGIAHEFNNFLGVVLGYSELLSEEAVENEKLARYVKEIRAATQHAASLTRQILAFSRKQVLKPEVLDLNRCIWEAHKLLRRLVPANIDVVPVLAPTIGRVRVDAGQLQQILINLVVNARDAMPPHGGKVIIETTDAELDEDYASRHGGPQPGSYVLLSVSDSGLGMNAETRSHIFEPFYTTKNPGEGTGLGLSTVYGIVKQSGGDISVESIEGKGTTFRIYLPLLQEATEESEIGTSDPIEQARPATILVVEDETALRRLICFSLEKRNHTVLAARDGVEAVEIFRQHAAQIQLIVTDLMMPRMNGLELKQHIAALRPDVKFLFMSGYAEHILEQHRASLEGCAFMEKPFLPGELADKISGLLARSAAA
jgi:two-component system cell cycle sensor histidine kinase/response regulator CckA